MVLLEGIELSTSPLPRECSTTELQQRRGRVRNAWGVRTQAPNRHLRTAASEPAAAKPDGLATLPRVLACDRPHPARQVAQHGRPIVADAPDTLRRIADTGRARWGAAEGPVVSIGPNRPASLEWRLQDDASQRAVLNLTEQCRPFGLSGAWYADTAAGEIDIDLPFALLARLLAAPIMPPDEVERVCGALAAKLPGRAVPEPRRISVSRTVTAKSRPVLTLLPRVLERDSQSYWMIAPYGEELPVAQLHFAYDDVLVPASDARTRFARNGALLEVARDEAAEREACAQLAGTGLGRLRGLFLTLTRTIPSDDLTVTDRGRDWMGLYINAQRSAAPARRGLAGHRGCRFPAGKYERQTGIFAGSRRHESQQIRVQPLTIRVEQPVRRARVDFQLRMRNKLDRFLGR